MFLPDKMRDVASELKYCQFMHHKIAEAKPKQLSFLRLNLHCAFLIASKKTFAYTQRYCSLSSFVGRKMVSQNNNRLLIIVRLKIAVAPLVCAFCLLLPLLLAVARRPLSPSSCRPCQVQCQANRR